MSLYQERHGLPAFGLARKERKVSPFVRELQLLAQTPGIVESFLPTIEAFSPNRRDAQEVIKLLDWGRRYHRSDLSSAFHEARRRDDQRKLMEVAVSVPTVTKLEDGSRSVTIPIGATKLTANLLGIVGARYDGEGLGVIFDGVAVLRNHQVYSHNAVLIGISSRTGLMHFHPDFLPENFPPEVKVDQVIPQFRTTRPLGE